MPTNRYALEKGGQQRLEISWKSYWKNITIRLDGREIGSIHDEKELKTGREFSLGDGSILKVQLVDGLEVFRDGEPLPGSTSDPEEQLKAAYGIVFLIAGISIVAGMIAELFEVGFLLQRGIGLDSIIFGVLFLILGFYVKRRSMLALGIAVGLFAIDGILSVILSGVTSIGIIVARIFFLIPMIKGFGAISSLKQKK